MQDNIRFEVNQEDLDRIVERYGENLVQRATNIVTDYAEMTATEARRILTKNKKRNTGRLIASIKPSLPIYARGLITGEVNAGAKYARFIHEGAKHVNGKPQPFFVPFRVAPSLLEWAKRKRIIVRREGAWNFIQTDSNGQKTYRRINNIYNSGLKVHHEPLKFFSKPFEERFRQRFIDEMTELARSM